MDFGEAAQHARRMSQTFQAFAQIEAVLREAASAEQATREAEAALAAARVAQEAAQGKTTLWEGRASQAEAKTEELEVQIETRLHEAAAALDEWAAQQRRELEAQVAAERTAAEIEASQVSEGLKRRRAELGHLEKRLAAAREALQETREKVEKLTNG